MRILTSVECESIAVSQMRAAGVDPQGRLVAEPVARNTAPAIALALAHYVLQSDSAWDDLYLVLPADHYISPVETLKEVVRAGREAAERGKLVLFGVRPTAPDTGFGYIEAGSDDGLMRPVGAFIEKPDANRAAALLLDGHYWWNTGMFLFRGRTVLDLFLQHLPTVGRALEAGFEALWKEFPALPDTSLDYGVVEKADCLEMACMDLTWSDVGSWKGLQGLLEKDERGNAALGPVTHLNSRRCLFLSQKQLLVANGVEDLAVVVCDDAVLVSSLAGPQNLKECVASLENRAGCAMDNSGVRGTLDRLLEKNVRMIALEGLATSSIPPAQGHNLLLLYGRVKVKGTAGDAPLKPMDTVKLDVETVIENLEEGVSLLLCFSDKESAAGEI